MGGVKMFNACIKVNEWMSDFNGQWGIAGGWAIDLFIGKETRLHSDIEIALFREDQHALKKGMSDWTLDKVVKGELISWEKEWLTLPVHEIHGTHKLTGERLEVLLNETMDGEWSFRRESSITFPENSLFLDSTKGIPYLHPAVVLLYKAKDARKKDHTDFFAARNFLKIEDKDWLRQALQVHVPGHIWIPEL